MIYTERKVSIKNDIATIDSPIILFRGDREVEIMFTIVDSKFKFESNKGNVIDKTQAAFGQLAVDLPDGTDLFTEIVECENGVVVFSITGEMIDEIHEVGFYSFHIRLYNDDKTSRITLPPVMEGIEIREPLIIEGDVENTDLVGDATVGYSMIQAVGADEEVFDEDGNYIPTVWGIGDKITADKLNKIEEGVEVANANSKTVNENMEYIDLIKDNCETEVVINYGEDEGSRAAISTFSGWGTPFRKENVPQQNIYGYSTCVTVYDNSTNKNIMKNVELDLYLLSKETLETEQFSIVRKLASAVLIEPGEVKFDFTMAYEDWPDIFALFVYNTEGYNLLLNVGYLNSNYKDHDIACVYATGKNDIPTYFANSTSNYFITTAHKFYGNIEFKPNLELDSIPTEIYKNTTWDLPTHIYAVEDDTLEMFTTGMVNSNIPYDYHMCWNGAVGALYTRKFMYTPVSADLGKTFKIRCELRDHAGFLQDVHNMTLHVESKPSNPSSMKTILMVGDSLTRPGQWPHELYRRLVATDGDPVGLGLTNFQTIGRCEHNQDGLVVKYEGYGGWNYEHFYSNLERLKQYWITTEATKPIAYQKSVWKDGNNNNWVLETIEEGRMKFYRQDSEAEYILPESGSLVWVSGGDSSVNTDIVYTQTAQESSNPFWDDDEDVLNVQKFVESQGASTVDYMICLLGWNQVTNVPNVTQEAIKFVNAMHEQMPNMKIILCGLQPPNPDGCAANYGLGYGNGYANPVELRRQVALYNDNLEQISIENDFVYFVHVSSQYDYEYGSITKSMEISKRYPTKVVQGINGVHPGTIGYMQIADAIYRRFVAILNEDNN